MEVSDLNIMENCPHRASSTLMHVTHIKEEGLSDHEDADEDGGWIAMDDTEEEILQAGYQRNEVQENRTTLNACSAEHVQTSQTTGKKGVIGESNKYLTNDRDAQSHRTKIFLQLDKQVTRAKKTLRPPKTLHLSKISPTNDVHNKKSENGNQSAYYCDECSEALTTKKLLVMHTSHHEKDSRRRREKDEKIGRTDTKITKEEHEDRSVIEDASEIRKRLGLRLRRSIPVRFQNGAENRADSISEDEDKQYRRRKQLAPRENQQIIIKAENSEDDSSSRIDVKKHETTAMVQRIQRRRPRKLKCKLPNMCPQCGHCFKKKTDLQRHLRVHSGEKPYACELCDLRFTRNFGLQCHMRTHAGLKIHVCCTCGKSYSRRYDLMKHERAVHTGERKHICADCDKRFVTAQLLRAHERIHTNSQPYLCQECGHKSNHRSDLKKHMRTHTNERPYCCQICKKSFMQSGSLTSHMINNHGK